MLTSTNKADLTAEIRALTGLLDDLLYTAEAPIKAIHVGTFGPKGSIETLRPLVQWSKPEEPQHPTETLYNALYGIKELVEDTSNLERKGSELYDRLSRVVDLLELAAV